MEPIVQKTKQSIENMLIELKSQRAFHEQALAQISDTITTLEAAVATIVSGAPAPTAAKPSARAAKAAAKTPKTPAKTASKPAKAASKSPSKKPAAKKAAPKKSAAKKTAPKKSAAKKGAPKSTAARLAAVSDKKLSPTTAVAAAGFSPRIVKFCKGLSIETLAELATYDLYKLASSADRIGEGAILEMTAALKRAGLKPAGATKPNGVPAPTAAASA